LPGAVFQLAQRAHVRARQFIAGAMFARANSSLVRKGYEVAGVAIDSALKDALDAIDAVCTATDLWYEAALQRGQVQYLNNHEVGHYRSAFEDFDEPERKRHLYRLQQSR
jgi:alpha-ketoglutarate-dependent taurine dioxygenase